MNHGLVTVIDPIRSKKYLIWFFSRSKNIFLSTLSTAYLTVIKMQKANREQSLLSGHLVASSQLFVYVQLKFLYGSRFLTGTDKKIISRELFKWSRDEKGIMMNDLRLNKITKNEDELCSLRQQYIVNNRRQMACYAISHLFSLSLLIFMPQIFR